jgi:hypothetical protein
MPIATNPDTGDVVFLDNDGKWSPAKTAVNPKTREMMAYDGKDWQKVSTHGHGILSYVDDAVRSIASGITFGYADRLAAGMESLTGVGGAKGKYEENLAREQRKTAEVPGAIRIPGEIAGAVAGTVAAAPATAVVGAATGLARLPAVAKIIAGGAAGGAAFGSSEGDTPQERFESAVKGAGLGAATGGLFAAGGRALSAIRSPTERATAQLTRAMGRDEVTAQEAAQRARALDVDRPGVATVADVGGENVKGLVERVAQTPGAGRTTMIPFLDQRQQQQMTRVAGDLTELTGSRRTALQAVNETMAQRAEAASPLYQAAYQAGDRAIWSTEGPNSLERLSSSPTIKSAMQGAVRIWRDNAVADGFGAMNPGALVDRGGRLSFSSGQLPAFPNLQFWDYTKRLMDDKVRQAIRAGQGQKARTLTRLTEQLRTELDRLAPEYRAARDAWSGPTSYLDAVESGRGILSRTESAEEMIANFRTLSAADRQGYREAAVSSIIGKMSSDPAKLGDMTKYLRSPAMREKVLAMMPNNEARQAWQRRLDFEIQSSEMVGRARGNSATARRLAEMEDAEGIGTDLVVGMLKGKPSISLIEKLAMGAWSKTRDRLRSKTDAELARMLTGTATAPATPRRRVLGQRALLPSAGAIGTESGLIQQ